MGKKQKKLFPKLFERERLWASYRLASLGKRETFGYLNFKQYEAANIEFIAKAIENETYRPEPHHEFSVFEPKERKISALPFLDRIVQHSIHSVIGPVFEKVFMPSSFACRDGKGTHAGAKHVQSMIRKSSRNAWVLKLDFKGFFKNIDREVLWKEIERKISCTKTLGLLEQFHPKTGKGLPIGNLTSQLLANVYGHILDRHITHNLKLKTWARYMDDTIIISESKDELERVFKNLSDFIKIEMRLEWSKWSISPVQSGVNFLGYRIWATHKLIRSSSVRRAKRKVKLYKKTGAVDSLNKFKASWLGHIQHGNCHNLKKSIFGEEYENNHSDKKRSRCNQRNS